MSTDKRPPIDWQFAEDPDRDWNNRDSGHEPTGGRRVRYRWVLVPLVLIFAFVVWQWWPAAPSEPADPSPTAVAQTSVTPVNTPAPTDTPVPTTTPVLDALPRPAAYLYHFDLSQQGSRGIMVLNPLTGSLIRRVSTSGFAQFAVSSDGSTLYVADAWPGIDDPTAGRLRIFGTERWDLRTQTRLDGRVRLRQNYGPPSLVVAPDNSALYVQRRISDTYTIDRIDALSADVAIERVVGPEAVTTNPVCDQVRQLFASPDNRWLYDRCGTGILQWHDVQRQSTVHSLDLTGMAKLGAASSLPPVVGASVAGDRLWGVTSAGRVVTVDLQAGRIITSVDLSLPPDLTVMPNMVIAAGTPSQLILGLGNADNTLRGLADTLMIVNPQTWLVINIWHATTPFATLAVSPDGELVATSDPVHETLTVARLATGDTVRTMPDTGISWSGVTFAPAPGSFDLPNEQLYVVDAGGAAAGPAIVALRADNGEQVFRLEANATGVGEPPEISVAHAGKWLWLLEGDADGTADNLSVIDTRSGERLAAVQAAHRLPMAAGSYWPPRILSGLSDNLVIQRAGRGRFPVWLENYLYTPAGIHRQVEPPFTYNVPVCGQSQLLLHAAARQLIAVCQPDGAATRVQEIQLGRGPGGRRDVLTTTLPGDVPGRSAALSPDGSTLYVVSDGPVVTALKLGSGAVAGPYDLTAQTRLAFGGIITESVPGTVLGQPIVSPDGSTLYLALHYPRDPLGYNTLIGTLQAIDTQTWRVKARMGMERQIVDLAVSADGYHLFALENSTQHVFVFDTRRNTLVREFALPAVNPVRIHMGAAP